MCRCGNSLIDRLKLFGKIKGTNRCHCHLSLNPYISMEETVNELFDELACGISGGLPNVVDGPVVPLFKS